MFDIHCHILPYVDDGAKTLEQARLMLMLQKEQGVSKICLTPHLRKSFFETSDVDIEHEFCDLKEFAKKLNLQILLTREYFCDENFVKLMKKRRVLDLNGRLLIEFSRKHTKEDILFFTSKVVENGYTPILVHIERFSPFRDKKSDIFEKIVSIGGEFQINTWCVLKDKRFARFLLKKNLVHYIASDCHEPYDREPNLAKIYKYLKKRLPSEQFNRIFYENPSKLFNNVEDFDETNETE